MHLFLHDSMDHLGSFSMSPVHPTDPSFNLTGRSSFPFPSFLPPTPPTPFLPSFLLYFLLSSFLLSFPSFLHFTYTFLLSFLHSFNSYQSLHCTYSLYTHAGTSPGHPSHRHCCTGLVWFRYHQRTGVRRCMKRSRQTGT